MYRIGKIVSDQPPGKSLCLDGTWSTFGSGGGRCSYHGGLAVLNKKVYNKDKKKVLDIVEVEKENTKTEVVEVENIGVYRFAEYTTRKGKTGKTIEIKFFSIPTAEVRELIKGKGKFWWDRLNKVWRAWDSTENRKIIEHLPLVLEGEVMPVLNNDQLKSYKRQCSRDQKLPFPIVDPTGYGIQKSKAYTEKNRWMFECIMLNADRIETYNGREWIAEANTTPEDLNRRFFAASKPYLSYRGQGKFYLDLYEKGRNSVYQFESNSAKGEYVPPKIDTSRLPKTVIKFKKASDTLENQIDNKLNTPLKNLNVTNRRLRMMSSMEQDAKYLMRVKNILLNFNKAVTEGRLDSILHGIDSKALVEQIMYWKSYPDLKHYADEFKELTEHIKGYRGAATIREKMIGGRYYYNYGRISPEEVYYTKEAFKIAKKRKKKLSWRLKDLEDRLKDLSRLHRAGITYKNYNLAREALLSLEDKVLEDPKEVEAREVQKMVNNLVGRKIPGYFNTPPGLVSKIVGKVNLSDGMEVLEPSAGAGDIADEIKKRYPGIKLSVIEIDPSLREILQRKGYDIVGYDFLQHKGSYDAIIMNPPFEKKQDIDHVSHAYKLLKSL